MKNKTLSVLLGCVLLILCSGVHVNAAKSIKYFVLTPPEQMLENVKKIAVLDFSGARGRSLSEDGKKASDYIVAALLKKDRGIHVIEKAVSGFLKKEGIVRKGSLFDKVLGKGSEGKTFQQGFSADFYEISERSRINQIIEEQKFSNSGMVDADQAAELGKVLGVDAVISGNVAVTAERKRYYSKASKEYFYMNEASATLSMRIVGISSGRVIGQKVATRKVSVPAAENPVDIVKEEAVKAAAVDLVLYFAPSFRLEKIKFQVLKSRRHKSAGKKAVKFLERGEFGKSLAIYSSIVEKDPYNHKAVYMQGVLYELACNYDKALERYHMAYQIFDESDAYHHAVERVEGQKTMWRVLNKHDIHMKVMDLSVSEGQVAGAGGRKIKLKGNSKDRVSVYAEPGSGNVLVKVPGGLNLDVVAREKDFYKVKLITGQEGYVSMKDAK